MMWKTKAEKNSGWRGGDGQIGTPGFVILKGQARGKPTTVEPNTNIMEKKYYYYKQLTGDKMHYGGW